MSALRQPDLQRPPSAPTSRRYQSVGYRAKKLLLYVLTVAVSVSSGAAAMSSVFPDQLGPLRVEISVAFVVLLAWATCGASARRAGSSPSPPTCTWSAWAP